MNYYSKVGLIGTGFVGSQVKKWFKGCAWYSKSGGSFEKVDKKPFVFLCLPTPYSPKLGFDISILVENIKRLTPKKNIIIKSTVLPHTTDMLQQMFPQHRFFFNPEFLIEKTAKKNFFEPERQIVGYASEIDVRNQQRTAREILDMLPDAPFKQVCESAEAEMTKLIGNCYLATKVVFANQMFDYCEQEGVKYDDVITMVTADSRIGNSHWKIWMDKHRGYSGHCFPKDMNAVIFDSGSKLLKQAALLNERYLEQKP